MLVLGVAASAFCGGCVLSRSDKVNKDDGAVAQAPTQSDQATGQAAEDQRGERLVESASLVVPATGYVAAFDATREVLKEQRFELDRVDARGGVITTRAKSTSGFATPWDTEQSTTRQEWSDLVSQHQRTVRVVFELQAGGEPKAGPRDLLASSGAMVARVEVKVERIQRPGWRTDARALRYSTYTFDPELLKRRELPSYATPGGADGLLAQRIAGEIAQEMKARGAGAAGAGR